MIKDLLNNVLPGKERKQIEELLGKSPSRDDFADCASLDWDLIYPIGKERIFIYDHRGMELSPDTEYLILRIGPNGQYDSWFIDGSTRWPSIVGESASRRYSATRNEGS